MSIKSEITRLQNAKTAIATAIKNKGVSVPTGTKLDEMGSLINNISTGTSTSDATAIASDVLQGKTAYNATGKITGTIASYSGEHTDGAEEGTAGIFPSGTLNVTQVGTYDVTNYASATFSVSTEAKTVTPSASTQNVTPTSGKYLSKVTVNPIPSNYIIPSGTKTITSNGTHDVSTYASVSVNVASSGGEDPDTPSGGTQTCTIILEGPSAYSFEMYCVKTLSAGEEIVDMKWYASDSFIEIPNVVCGSLITVVVSGVVSIPGMRVSFYEPVPYDGSPGSVAGNFQNTFVLQAPTMNFGVPSLFELYDND